MLTLVPFYFIVLKPWKARRNSALSRWSDLILKPELDAEETAVHEIDGRAALPPEIDGWQTKVYEMPTVDEIDSETEDSEAGVGGSESRRLNG